MKIDLDDQITHKICCTCADKLVESHEFHSMYLETLQTLLEKFENNYDEYIEMAHTGNGTTNDASAAVIIDISDDNDDIGHTSMVNNRPESPQMMLNVCVACMCPLGSCSIVVNVLDCGNDSQLNCAQMIAEVFQTGVTLYI